RHFSIGHHLASTKLLVGGGAFTRLRSPGSHASPLGSMANSRSITGTTRVRVESRTPITHLIFGVGQRSSPVQNRVRATPRPTDIFRKPGHAGGGVAPDAAPSRGRSATGPGTARQPFRFLPECAPLHFLASVGSRSIAFS